MRPIVHGSGGCCLWVCIAIFLAAPDNIVHGTESFLQSGRTEHTWASPCTQPKLRCRLQIDTQTPMGMGSEDSGRGLQLPPTASALQIGLTPGKISDSGFKLQRSLSPP